MRKVEVVPYNNQWPFFFEKESGELKRIFGTEIIEIHHIGSTSVAGLSAKPVIDMIPVARDITQIDAYNDAMKENGYEAMGENGIRGRRYFQKGGDERTHHVHIFEAGDPAIERHLAFRNYLRAHSNAAKQYGDLKEELSRLFPYDMESYIEGKAQFVADMEQKALLWYRN
ncbi:GrpB family protein [Virgibacillus doumboii]|uniref:GrpB family protein n=1 Tax=Virgibacillus doumboii TaxID=2697503 RepID=UPI0013E0D86D|nr:GrpB family protein [Virgibacillus doumboii]